MPYVTFHTSVYTSAFKVGGVYLPNKTHSNANGCSDSMQIFAMAKPTNPKHIRLLEQSSKVWAPDIKCCFWGLRVCAVFSVQLCCSIVWLSVIWLPVTSWHRMALNSPQMESLKEGSASPVYRDNYSSQTQETQSLAGNWRMKWVTALNLTQSRWNRA